MDLMQLAGIPQRNNLSFDESYDRIIEALGGLAAVGPHVPFSLDTLAKAYAKDPSFNTLPMWKWDEAAGFSNGNRHSPGGTYAPTGRGLWPLLSAHGVRSASPSENVCLLKRAAERMVLEASRNAE